MTRRLVTATVTSTSGYVALLCNPAEEWSPRSVRDAVLDIELGSCSYFVVVEHRQAEVHTLQDSGGTYLGAHAGGTDDNLLLDLR